MSVVFKREEIGLSRDSYDLLLALGSAWLLIKEILTWY